MWDGGRLEVFDISQQVLIYILGLGAVRSMQEDLRGTPASRLYLQPTRGCFRRPVDQYKFKLVATTLPTSSLFPLTPPGRCKVLLPITIFKLASRGRRWFIIFQFNLYLFIYPLPPSLLICIPAVVKWFLARQEEQLDPGYIYGPPRLYLVGARVELGEMFSSQIIHPPVSQPARRIRNCLMTARQESSYIVLVLEWTILS